MSSSERVIPLLPVAHCLKPLFLWAPEYIFRNDFPDGVLPCPTCRTTARVTSEGWNSKGSRKVVDMDDVFFIWCKRYRCVKCNCTFNGYDSRVIAQLPIDVQHYLPCIINHRSAVSLSVVRFLINAITQPGGIDFSSMSALLRAQLVDKYRIKQVSWAASITKFRKNKLMNLGDFNILVENPLYFPDVDDKHFYSGHRISSGVLEAIYLNWTESTKEFHDRRQQMVVPGPILCGDGSRKAPKYIRIEGERVFDELYTTMSTYTNEIVSSHLVEANCSSELKPIRDGISRRCELMNLETPKLIYTDDCCHERSSWEDSFPSLREEGMEWVEGPCRILPVLSLLEGAFVKLIQSTIACDIVCSEILRIEEESALGFDIEWTVKLFTQGGISKVSSQINFQT